MQCIMLVIVIKPIYTYKILYTINTRDIIFDVIYIDIMDTARIFPLTKSWSICGSVAVSARSAAQIRPIQ